MKNKWIYEIKSYTLADTGDHEEYVVFTNGKDILQSAAEEATEQDLADFCRILNLMPDLWSHNRDALEFENTQLRKTADFFHDTLTGFLPFPPEENTQECAVSVSEIAEAVKAAEEIHGYKRSRT